MKDKYFIDDLYVGQISRQSEVTLSTAYEKFSNTYMGKFAEWDYTPIQSGIFVKTPLGYMHILSKKIYKLANSKTGNKVVIERPITPLLKCGQLVSQINQTKCDFLTRDQIKTLEQHINNISVVSTQFGMPSINR